MARPTIYTEELTEKICKKIEDGESIKSICSKKDMPNRSTIHDWILNNEEFSNKYKKAVDVRTENKFEEIEEIADNKGDVQRDRLRVDVRKWYLSKIMPKKFGEKIDVTSGGKPIPIMGGVPKKDDV